MSKLEDLYGIVCKRSLRRYGNILEGFLFSKEIRRELSFIGKVLLFWKEFILTDY